MTGDKHKSQSSFGRWIDAFDDGARKFTRGGRRRTPSLVTAKRYARRWRRQRERRALKTVPLPEAA